jgi:N-acetylmuramoyl-L-alanine amidase
MGWFSRTWVLLLALCCAGTPVLAAPVLVKDIRVWAGPDSTRVVFDLSGPATHSMMTLKNPDRVVVDIATARLENLGRQLPSGQGFIKQLRAGMQGQDLRLVVDLAEAATPRSFAVEPSGGLGHRLVLDLTPAKGASRSPAPLTPVKAITGQGRDIVVAIDAGHGGNDPGAIGRARTQEKDVTLAIARRLKARIDKEPGMRAVLTRDGDYFLPLRERIKRARDHQADMFISVHADAFHDRTVAGSSVYVLSARGASDEAATVRS